MKILLGDKMEHTIKDMIVKIPEEKRMWGIMWKDIVVCFTETEDWAKQIAWALDEAKPCFDTEP
jgi:hypothetical protein